MADSRRWQIPFFTIWTGQALSLVGSALVGFALIWWLTETTGSARTLALATTASLIPTILLGPFAGALVDRWPRKWVLIVSDGLIALLTALLGALFWLDVAQIWHVYAILFLRSLADRFQTPVMILTTALMVPQDQLVRVAGTNATLEGAIRFVAPPLGALLLAVVDVEGILPLDVVTAVLAILPLFFVRVPQPTVKTTTGSELRSIVQGFVEGLRYVWTRRGLRLEVATMALRAFFFQPVIAFWPLLVADHLGGGALELGWMQSVFGIGLIAGGVLLSVWGGFRRRMTTSFVGNLGVVLAAFIVSIAPANALWVAIVGSAIWGVALSCSGTRAALQIVVAPEMQGRFWTIRHSLLTAVGPLVLAVAGPLADRFGVRPFWFACAAGGLVIALIRRFVPAIYYMEDHPDRAGVAEASAAQVQT